MAGEKTENIKLMSENPKKAIVKLAYPMAISMFLMMLYNFADSVWVSGLGPDALSAIGFITPLYIILVGIGNGVGASANSLIARSIGAENYKQANNAGLHCVLLSVIISVVFTIVMLILMVPILKAFGAGSTIQYALDYGYIIFGLQFIFVFEELESAIFRSEGNMRRATTAMALTAIVNIILDPLLIYVFNMGISGAAWATVLSSGLSVVIMSYWIWFKKDLYLDLSPKYFNFKFELMKDALHVAIPSTFDNVIFSLLAIVINGMLVTAGGSSAVGVYTASMRIVQFATLPLTAIGIAVLTVSGVAYGAKNAKNLKITHSYSIKISFVIAIIMASLIYFLSPQIVLLYSYTEASASLAPQIQNALSILCLFVLTIPLGIMSTMMFQGVGKGEYSLTITLFRSLIFDSIFAYIFCFIFGWGLNGIFTGIVFGSFLGGVFGYIGAKYFIKKFSENTLDSNKINQH